jgi:hypothetical protein
MGKQISGQTSGSVDEPTIKGRRLTAPATVAMPNSPLIAGRRPDMTIPFRNDSGFFTYISTASRITSGELF